MKHLSIGFLVQHVGLCPMVLKGGLVVHVRLSNIMILWKHQNLLQYWVLVQYHAHLLIIIPRYHVIL